ncbi:hypothetical protein [Actomonas aquatica]|uniref:Knr4/Smi1-like domain-containing protein n=1 Tax=Actomonas aquatica TaxID=2866162 RepID=A0ABZ1C612_9BACT|nr:hypothetical protein [Opitutus sp. WL0086]WRQ86852.1 hypothetical protein K1X11_018730 [Opitutus sp. WL0086]
MLEKRVLTHWLNNGVEVVEPPSADLVVRSLEAAGLRVGRDYIDFLATVGGMVDHEWRLDQWAVWRLERVIAENVDRTAGDVFFADWCLSSHFHFLRQETAATSSVWVEGYESRGPRRVAESLTDFFERYLDRDQRIGVYFDD